MDFINNSFCNNNIQIEREFVNNENNFIKMKNDDKIFNIDELNNYKKENLKLKEQINKLIQENNKLKADLQRSKETAINIQIKDNQNINKINYLEQKLKDKEIEINNLSYNFSNNTNFNKFVDYNDVIIINFYSSDYNINHGIKCLKTDIFAEIEEKLYQKYNELRETNNIFIADGKYVKRFKKICENNIKDGDKIQLLKLDYN